MTHKCIKCDEKFPSSGQMVQHMREAHTSFVENAQMKIDKSQESSFEAKRSSGGYLPTAKCPFCMVDYATRKKLVLHLTVAHQDDEEEVEPEVKVLRVENDSDRRLLDHIYKEQASNNGISAASKSSIVSDLLSALETNEQRKVLSIPGTSDTIRVSATSFKIPEKRYRCFWCDASFRKRGKLMDHIDMFHKANKQQIEDEAELLVSAINQTPPVKENVQIKLTIPTLTKKVIAPSTAPKSQPAKVVNRRRTNSKKSSKTTPVEPEQQDIIINNVCKFIRVASITEVSREKYAQKIRHVKIVCETNCIFFKTGEPNPLPPLVTNTKDMVCMHTEELFPPIQYTLPSMTYPSEAFDESSHFSPNVLYKTHDANFGCVPSYYTLPKPQPIYPSAIDSAIRLYTHQMALNDVSMGERQHEEQEQTTRLMDYHRHEMAQPLHFFGYPSYRHNPEIPLDLTVTKY